MEAVKGCVDKVMPANEQGWGFDTILKLPTICNLEFLDARRCRNESILPGKEPRITTRKLALAFAFGGKCGDDR